MNIPLVEVCLGSLCLISIMFLVTILGSMGSSRADEQAAKRQFKKKFKVRNK